MFNKDDDVALTLPPDVTKHLEYIPDPKMENSGKYKMWLEDHTMGNALRMQLFRNPHVVFAGYRQEHPLIPNIELNIQTTAKSSPYQALKLAYTELYQETKSILTQFQQQMRDRGVAGFQEVAPEIADVPPQGLADASSNRFSEMSDTDSGDDDILLPQLQDDKNPLSVEDIEMPFTGTAVSAGQRVDSGDVVLPAVEGETPVMSENRLFTDNVSNASSPAVNSSPQKPPASSEQVPVTDSSAYTHFDFDDSAILDPSSEQPFTRSTPSGVSNHPKSSFEVVPSTGSNTIPYELSTRTSATLNPFSHEYGASDVTMAASVVANASSEVVAENEILPDTSEVRHPAASSETVPPSGASPDVEVEDDDL